MRRLLTPAWLARHGLAATLVPAFLWLGWWQFGRAASGNALSWAYMVQWPIFAAFVAFLWWREVRLAVQAGAPARPRATAPTDGFRAPVLTRRAPGAGSDAGTADGAAADRTAADGDADLAAYNHYLAWLAAHPGARPADYPG